MIDVIYQYAFPAAIVLGFAAAASMAGVGKLQLRTIMGRVWIGAAIVAAILFVGMAVASFVTESDRSASTAILTAVAGLATTLMATGLLGLAASIGAVLGWGGIWLLEFFKSKS